MSGCELRANMPATNIPFGLLSIVLLRTVYAVPLQWEEIQPVGPGPAARRSHTMVSFSSSQDAAFLYGGVGQELYGDTWMYDVTMQSWVSVYFSKKGAFQGACEQPDINAESPGPRFGHAMASAGGIALMCGGVVDLDTFHGVGDLIDCWWFYPRPLPVWTRVKLLNATVGPRPRRDFVLRFDPVNADPEADGADHVGNFILHGGADERWSLLDDCWFLGNVNHSLGPQSVSEVAYQWQQCKRNSSHAVIPQPRSNHGSVFFSATQSLFIFGGFVSYEEGSILATQEMWALTGYHTDAVWTEVVPVSMVPGSRAACAMWLNGFRLWIHGGEGVGGEGEKSVLDDTWSFDLFTLVWKQFGTSDAVPVARDITVLSMSASEAISFGGMDKSGNALGKLFSFDQAEGWKQLQPAASGPPPRAAHLGVYVDASNRLLVHAGGNDVGMIYDDLWAFDTETSIWECLQGPPQYGCHRPASGPGASGPGPLSFHGGAQVDLYLMVYSGASGLGCSVLEEGGQVFSAFDLYLASGMWALNLASASWLKGGGRLVVQFAGSSSTMTFTINGTPLITDELFLVETGGELPRARIMTAMTGPGSAAAGSWVSMMGGATFDCMSRIGKNCTLPQPMNDGYMIDVRARPHDPSPENPDKMITFDGTDDLLQVILPDWCKSVETLSVLWIDAWVNTYAKGKVASIPNFGAHVRSVVFDLYNGQNSILRWYLDGVGNEVYARLALYPEAGATWVKSWGPLDKTLIGVWHHVTFTLRFARIFSRTSAGPAVTITQAFMFIDTVPVPEGGGPLFLRRDLDDEFVIKSGFTHLYVGSANPTIGATGYVPFAGSMDNLRVWWPPCPHHSDPTHCNPYGFLYPKLQDGTRKPASGVQDSEVDMKMVARPVYDARFMADVPWNTTDGGPGEGLLLYLDFNEIEGPGRLRDKSTWQPQFCSEVNEELELDWGHTTPISAFCRGCEPQCTFEHCEEFDLGCVARGVSSEASLRDYGRDGVCMCLNVEDCPDAVQECQCPEGTHQVCTDCKVSWLTSEGLQCSPEWPDFDVNNCFEMDPMYCPTEPYWDWGPSLLGGWASACNKYTCSCYNPYTKKGLYIRESVSAPETGEDQYCQTCPAGQIPMDSQQPLLPAVRQILWDLGYWGQPEYEYKCCDQLQYLVSCQGEFVTWKDEDTRQNAYCAEVLRIEPLNIPNLFTGSLEDCGISRCCQDVSTAPDNEESKDDASCTSFYAGTQLVFSCNVDSPVPETQWVGSLEGDTFRLAESPTIQSVSNKDLGGVSSLLRSEQPVSKKETNQASGVGGPGQVPKNAKTSDTTTKDTPAVSKPRPVPRKNFYPADNWHLDDLQGVLNRLPTLRSASSDSALSDPSRPQPRARTLLAVEDPAFDPQEAFGWDSYVTWWFEWPGPGELPLADYHGMLEGWAVAALTVNSVPPPCATKKDCLEDVQTISAKDSTSFYQGRRAVENGPGMYRTFVQATPFSVRLLSTEASRVVLGDLFSGMNVNNTGDFHYGGSWCGDGVSTRGEQCDNGYDLNNDFAGCTSACQCPTTFVPDATNTRCMCEIASNFEASVRESTAEQGANNTIEVALFVYTPFTGGLSVVTISGLVGSPTPSQVMQLECSWVENGKVVSDADVGGICFPLTLPPLGEGYTFGTPESEIPFRFGHGTWIQETGTFVTTLLYPPQDRFCGSNMPCDPMKNFETAHLRIRFTIQNPLTGQDSIHPTVTICSQSTMTPLGDATSRSVLGAGMVRRSLGQIELTATKDGKTIVRVQLPQALAADVDVSLHVRERSRGVSVKQLSRVPQGAQVGGLDGVLLVAADLAVEADLTMELNMAVDVLQGRAAGGCVEAVTPHSLRVCVSGWPVLTEFVVESETWEPVGPRSLNNKGQEFLNATASLSKEATFAVMSTVPCCNYEGEGRACGDMVCLDEEARYNPMRSVALLGGLTGSKLPSSTLSTRPASEQDYEDYLLSLASGTATLRTMTPWLTFAPPDDPFFGCTAEQPGWDSQSVGWIPARFGHTLVSVTSMRTAIYGGIGCARYSKGDKCSRVCEELTVLNDLWEFDSNYYVAGLQPFKQYELSPALKGLGSPSGIPLAGMPSEFITLGGASNLAMAEMLQGKPVAPSVEVFEVRRISFREGKVASSSLGKFSSVIAHSAVYNDTHVIIYGGYIRNRLSSAVLIYDLNAASPLVGLSRAPGLEVGTKRRAFPALSKPNDQTLLMFGGVRSPSNQVGTMTYEANSELWHLDLATQRWRQIHDSDVGPPLRAFQATASWSLGGDVLLLAHGGFVGGFNPNLNSLPELTPLGAVWPASQLGQEFESKWYGMHMLTPFPGEDCCMTHGVLPARCGSRPIVGCPVDGMAMHSIVSGNFVAGYSSLLVYGGVRDRLLSSRDMWYMDTQHLVFGYEFDLVLQGVTLETFDDGSAFGLIENLVVNGFYQNNPQLDLWFATVCPSMLTGMMYDFKAVQYDLGDGIDRVIVKYSTAADMPGFTAFPGWAYCFDVALTTAPNGPEEIWASLMLREGYSESLLNTSKLVWEEQTTTIALAEDDEDLLMNARKDGLLDAWMYSDEDDCITGCRRGICQGIVEGTMQGEVRTDKTMAYCRGDGVGHCSKGYECGLPLERSGHKMVKFTMGSNDVVLLFGGEKTNPRPDISRAELSSDVHAGFFSLSAVTFSKLWVAGSKGTSCDGASCGSSNCPCARRDASIAVLGNVGSANGKLLLFGGIAAAGASSPGWTYLTKGDSSAVIPLNDLWYLDLSSLTETCVKDGICSSALLWTKIEVPGRAVPARWGAGIVLDTADNLYITGGATVRNGAWTEVGDLYVFQLGDPFYKKCSATGKGLTMAEAGVPAVFYLQCKDALDAPANGARFRIDISGPVDMTPEVLAVGTGLYKCEFLPVRASSDYTITIMVGRGGSDYQDLIAGVDGDPSDSVHDYRGFYGDLGGNINPNPFSLKVVPGSTDPWLSVVAGGAFSLTTAGTISSFSVLARDSFLNRRPGGDSISILMHVPTAVNALPKTATVTDNSDGSYTAVYAITQSGAYKMFITFGSVVGAGTPTQLVVQTAEALIERSYVYGSLLSIKAGETSTIFVQTRDRYGNKLRVDPRVVPEGSEDIKFELCTVIGDDDDASPCRGGAEDSNVGITIDYGYSSFGILNTTENGVVTSTPNFGLYRISFFPFNFGDSFVVEVTHNEKRIPCYFESQDDPGADLADACYTEHLEETASSDSRRTYKGAERVTLASQLSRDPNKRKTAISKAFIPPETKETLWWVMFAPIFCAGVGLFVELCLTICRILENRREKKMLIELDSAWNSSTAAALVNLHPSKNHPENTKKVRESLVAGSVFTAAGSNGLASARDANLDKQAQVAPVAPVAPVAEDMDDVTKLVADLEARGLLASDEAANFRTLIKNKNPASQGVIDAHLRALERTARTIKHMAGKDVSSTDSALMRGHDSISLSQDLVQPAPPHSLARDVVRYEKPYVHKFRV